jgi:dihydropyrimidinase
LYLTWDAYDAPGVDGALPVCSPPIRGQTQQDALWQALQKDDLQMVTTDHCPFTRGEKATGLDDFSQIPGGVPSIEMRFTAVYQGVQRGILSLNQWVDLCCTAPAKLMGLRNKGDIAAGYDADLVIFDPNKQITLSTDFLHEKVDWTPYEGLQLQGWPRTTLCRGQMVVDNGVLLVDRGYGRFQRMVLKDEG